MVNRIRMHCDSLRWFCLQKLLFTICFSFSLFVHKMFYMKNSSSYCTVQNNGVRPKILAILYSSTKTTRAVFASVVSLWFSYCCRKLPMLLVLRHCFECNKTDGMCHTCKQNNCIERFRKLRKVNVCTHVNHTSGSRAVQVWLWLTKNSKTGQVNFWTFYLQVQVWVVWLTQNS